MRNVRTTTGSLEALGATRFDIGGVTDHGPILAGAIVLAVTFGGFGIWSYLAPLSGAAVAAGEIRVDTHRKAVQHLEGGIIREILVSDGDIVAQGEVIARLDTISASSDRDMLAAQQTALRAAQIRLVAERDNQPLEFPATITDPTILASQRAIYDSRNRALATETDIFNQRIEQSHAQIDGYRAQIDSYDQQAVLLKEEIKDKTYLNNRGLEAKPKLLEVQRMLASTLGNRAQNISDIAKAEQAIGESKVNIIKLHTDDEKEVAKELKETEEKLSDVTEKLRKASDVMNRTDILAPQAGKVINLKQFTRGGVLKAAETMMEIVPAHDGLIVESRIEPKDISMVHAGLPATVKLLSYKQRRTPTLNATVRSVAADVQTDEKAQTTKSYYTAEIEISPEQLATLPEIKLYPGMPAEVMIETTRRTAFQYFTDPIRDSFWRSFREN